MSGQGKIHIGTSGWNYNHWKGPFYPEDLPSGKWLDFYMEKFDTVEINNSFYHLPAEKTFDGWRDKSPDHFIFSVKASRYITHMKKLKDPREPVERFFKHADRLEKKQGPVLFQLPPRWKANPERLRAFLSILPEGRRYTMEFRDETWWDEKVFSLLREFRVAFCLFELAGQQTPEEITADFVYIRLHGPDGPYAGQYNDRTLRQWSGSISVWVNQGMDVYCYFDNDQYGYAAKDALRLRQMVEFSR